MLIEKLSFRIGTPCSIVCVSDVLSILHDLIRDALARFQINLDIHRQSFFSKIRAFIGVPGCREWRAVNRLVVRYDARKELVFARRDVVEHERAFRPGYCFRVTQHVFGRFRVGGNQMQSQSRRQSRALVFRGDFAAQTRRARLANSLNVNRKVTPAILSPCLNVKPVCETPPAGLAPRAAPLRAEVAAYAIIAFT